MLDCARDQRIDLFPAADIASNDMRIAARKSRCLEAIGDVLFARRALDEARRRQLTAEESLERTGLLLGGPLLVVERTANRRRGLKPQ